MKSIAKITTAHCTGCGACVAICPVKAISYAINEDGFFEAQVDENKCIECGKCTTVCFRFDMRAPVSDITDAAMYAAQSTTPRTIFECTSGGIAHEIAQWAIRQGHYVLGTIYNHTTEQAEMRVARTAEEIEAFKGSKYLQSNSAAAISEMLMYARQNKAQGFVVFGTPCQIYGLRRLITETRLPNPFYYIDLFCHGVPSYLVWNTYRKELGFEKTTYVEFRDHQAPWHFFHLKIADSEKCQLIDKEKSSFYQLFFDNQSLNYACTDCPVRKRFSAADIRLGDFWGKRYANRLDGVSLCALLTENGEILINRLVKDARICILQEVPATEGIAAQSTHSYISNQQTIFKEIRDGAPLSAIIKSYRRKANLKRKVKWSLKKILAELPLSIQISIRRLMSRGTNGK